MKGLAPTYFLSEIFKVLIFFIKKGHDKSFSSLWIIISSAEQNTVAPPLGGHLPVTAKIQWNLLWADLPVTTKVQWNLLWADLPVTAKIQWNLLWADLPVTAKIQWKLLWADLPVTAKIQWNLIWADLPVKAKIQWNLLWAVTSLLKPKYSGISFGWSPPCYSQQLVSEGA